MENQENLRCNNFNMLRFIAALMVMAGHMAYIDGSNNVPIVWGQGIQSLGVKIFFLIGGYLISKSWLIDPHPIRYGIKRIFRIMPPLIVYTILTVFILGPFLSNLSLVEYFINAQTYKYLLNIIFFPIYALPGVFENTPYPIAVNGSLWTLPIEAVMYILVPIILVVINNKKASKNSLQYMFLLTILACTFQLLHLEKFPMWRKVVWGTDLGQACTLIPYYFLGMLFTDPKVKKWLNLQIAVVMMLIYFCISSFLDGTLNELMTYIVLSYSVFSFALLEKPFFGKYFSKFEISYGIYLYGFLVQQVVAFLCQKYGISIGTIVYLVISLIITSFLAVLSVVFVEKPFQKISRLILKRCS